MTFLEQEKKTRQNDKKRAKVTFKDAVDPEECQYPKDEETLRRDPGSPSRVASEGAGGSGTQSFSES